MGLFRSFVNQTRKPQGFLGKMMLGGMNGSGHAKMADWGMSQLDGIKPSLIAELGCGGGRNAGELINRYPASKLVAIDYSNLSVEKSKKYNEKAVADGRCVVRQGDVSKLDLPGETFDLATAFADPENEALIQKALKTLTQGRTVIMIAHRLSTVVGADRIVVLEGGKVIEEGTHEELAKGGGLYERMWKEYNQAVRWKIESVKEGARK